MSESLPDGAYAAALAGIEQMTLARLSALLRHHPPAAAWRVVLGEVPARGPVAGQAIDLQGPVHPPRHPVDHDGSGSARRPGVLPDLRKIVGMSAGGCASGRRERCSGNDRTPAGCRVAVTGAGGTIEPVRDRRCGARPPGPDAA